MSFPIVTDYKFDITGEDPSNLVDREPHDIDFKDFNPILGLNHSPFYCDSVKIYKANLELAIEGEDYEFYYVMGGLTAYTGRKVAGLIRFFNNDLSLDITTKRYYVTYQTLGDTDMWDANLFRLIAETVADDRPVYWSKLDQSTIPTGFPSDVHSQSLMYNLTSFKDSVAFVGDLIDLIEGKVDVLGPLADKMLEVMDQRIARFKTLIDDLYTNHINSTNAHGLTKEQIGLGNLDNFRTATKTETVVGASQELRVKPGNLKYLLDKYSYNPNSILKTHTLKMSSFGGKSFIPPSVDGAFEALGVRRDRGHGCVEPDGSVSILIPRNDGRNTGVYFSRLDHSEVSNNNFRYTGHKYRHQRFIDAGINPTGIAGGSNGEVMVMGVEGDNTEWYITLTNGTFDPAKHDYKHLDVSNCEDITTNLVNLSVHHFGDIIVLFSHSGGSPYGGGFSESFAKSTMFYINVSDLKDSSKIDVQPLPWNVSYEMIDGTKFTGTNVLWYTPTDIDPDTGLYNRYWHEFTAPAKLSGSGGYRSCNISHAINPNNSSEVAFNIARHFYLVHYDANNNAIGRGASYEIAYVRKGNVLTLQNYSGHNTYDQYGNYVSGGVVSTASSYRTSRHSYLCSSMLGNGKRLTLYGRTSLSGSVVGCYLENVYSVSDFDWIKNVASQPSMSTTTLVERMSIPIQRGVIPGGWFPTRHGYLYQSSNPNYGFDTKLAECFLHIPGPKSNLPYYNWEDRGLGVSGYEGALSLPIPTVKPDEISDIYRNNMLTSISGNDAFLKSVSAGYGITYDNACSSPLKDRWNYSDEGRNKFNSLISDNGVVVKNPAGEWIFYPSSIINQFKALRTESPLYDNYVGLTVYDYSTDINKGSGYAGSYIPGFSVIFLITSNYVGRKAYGSYVVIEPTLAPNTSNQYHSDIDYIVTGYRLIYKSGWTGLASNITSWSGGNFAPSKTVGSTYDPQTSMYVDGDNISVFCFDPQGYGWVGNAGYTRFMFTATKSGNTIKDVTPHHMTVGYQYEGPSFYTACPRVGMVRRNESRAGSGCVDAAHDINNTSQKYILTNSYMGDGFVIYIEATDLVFNGEVYEMEATTIDLRSAYPSAYTNEHFYIYCKVVNDTASFFVSKDKFSNTINRIWIGECATNNTQIVTISRNSVMTLNGISVSAIRQGSSILVANGSINETGKVEFLRENDITS